MFSSYRRFLLLIWDFLKFGYLILGSLKGGNSHLGVFCESPKLLWSVESEESSSMRFLTPSALNPKP